MPDASDALTYPELETAHVLFMDIVGWSKLSIDQQTAVVFKLQQIVSANSDFARAQSEGMVCLPTGDGMALVFFRRPEAPVRWAMEIARTVKSSGLETLKLRMGVHSGLVYQSTDINGRKSVVGDGINITQRVMDCGDAAHILLSEDLASQLRRVTSWAEILHDLGKVEVKHGVEVHLFNLHTAEVGNAALPCKLQSRVASQLLSERLAPPAPPAVAGSKTIAFLYQRTAPADEQLRQTLEAQLIARGNAIFTDDRKPGMGLMEWAKHIDNKVRTSDFVVALLSESSISSEMVTHEIQSAHEVAQQQSGKPCLIPLRVTYLGPLPDTIDAILSSSEHLVWQGSGDDQRVGEELLAAIADPGRLAKKKEKRSAIALEELEAVGGAVPLNSKFYEERAADRQFLAAIARRDSIVLLKGARQMGKTSLLARGLQRARELGSKVILTDFQEFNANQMESLEKLYHVLSESLADQLDLDRFLSDTYNANRSPNANFERYLRREVLDHLGCPLVWGLDEVDRLFTCPYGGEIFALFRTWHNKRALDPTGPWSNFTLAIAYATEANLFITDINQSPFNVGTRLMLDDFTLEQVADLNARHGSPLHPGELSRYYKLVGGHPFLVRRGLHQLVNNMDFSTFEATADNDEGPLADHLRRLLLTVAQDDALCGAVRSILNGQPCPNMESFYRLRSSGVMLGDTMQEIRPRCQVYAAYLRRHLQQ